MCGICGIYEKFNVSVDQPTLHAMTDAMVHRGPDDHGYFVDAQVGLGFRRLSIVDLEHGHQPMTNEDGTVWVVFNGEIYNYQDLRSDLTDRGHVFQTQADTEVIVHLYEEFGIGGLPKLRGMFGLAIYDARYRDLYLARDYFGIKPLFYANQSDSLVFASDIRSLLASRRVDAKVSYQSLWDYLSFQYVPDPNTMFKGIYKLPPAHYLHVRNGRVKMEQYWRAEFKPDDTKPLSYFVEGIEAKLRESVGLHMSGEVPRGAFLSSGVDSSAIAALMREREDIRTFSVGFEGAPETLNELAIAKDTAQFLGTRHHEVLISPQRYAEELPRMIYQQEDPVADASAIALYFVSELASSFITVVLSGEGADELFGGYPIYHEPLSLRPFNYLPSWARRWTGGAARHLPYRLKGRSFLERGSLPLERRFIGNARIFSGGAKQSLFRDAGGLVHSFAVTDRYYERNQHLDDVTRMQDIDIHTWLPGDILMKADRMTMVNSMELRVPFLDKEVFEFASTVPVRYRVAEGTTKYALRCAVRKILPNTVSARPKLGFPVPIRHWMRKEMLPFIKDVFASAQVDEYLNRQYAEQLLRLHCEGVRDYSREIWTVLTFMLWHQIYIEGTRVYTPSVAPSVAIRRKRTLQEQAAGVER